MVNKGPNCPTVLPRGEALFRWLIYRDRFPLAVPDLVGELEAPTLAAAKNLAAERWPGVPVLIQSAASARVKPFNAPPPAPVKRTNRGRPRPGARGQLDAFRESKRRAHDAATRGQEP